MGKKITQEEAERIFRENDYILIDKYKDAKTKMTAINKDGYRVYVSLDNIKKMVKLIYLVNQTFIQSGI